MKLKQATGPGAASRKYDLLSALMAHGLAGDKYRQRLVLRFMSLITTRYNWQTNELSMGQGDIARLWQVDTRTVKREIARLRAMGWVRVKFPGARGRVSVYAFDFEQVLRDTSCHWNNVGPDLAMRLRPQEPGTSVAPNVVPLHQGRTEEGETQPGAWGEICRQLMSEDAHLFAAWFAPLVFVREEAGVLELMAPSAFHKSYTETHLRDRLYRMSARVAPHIRRILLTL